MGTETNTPLLVTCSIEMCVLWSSPGSLHLSSAYLLPQGVTPSNSPLAGAPYLALCVLHATLVLVPRFGLPKANALVSISMYSAEGTYSPVQGSF